MEKGRLGIVLAGSALIAGFFMPWISVDFGPATLQVSAFQMMTQHGQTAAVHPVLLALVPLAGLAMVVTALLNHRWSRAVAFLSGAGILGYAGLRAAQVFFAISGWGIWLVVGAAVAGVVLALVSGKKR